MEITEKTHLNNKALRESATLITRSPIKLARFLFALGQIPHSGFHVNEAGTSTGNALSFTHQLTNDDMLHMSFWHDAARVQTKAGGLNWLNGQLYMGHSPIVSFEWDVYVDVQTLQYTLYGQLLEFRGTDTHDKAVLYCQAFHHYANKYIDVGDAVYEPEHAFQVNEHWHELLGKTIPLTDGLLEDLGVVR
jgi:hypothetical protein